MKNIKKGLTTQQAEQLLNTLTLTQLQELLPRLYKIEEEKKRLEKLQEMNRNVDVNELVKGEVR